MELSAVCLSSTLGLPVATDECTISPAATEATTVVSDNDVMPRSTDHDSGRLTTSRNDTRIRLPCRADGG